MEPRPEPLEVVVEKVHLLAGALEQAEIPYAFGGAIALAYCGEPRTTQDIDLNLFVSPDEAGTVLALLTDLGVTIDPERVGHIARDGQVRFAWDHTPLDLFFAYDAFHDACSRRANRVPFVGKTMMILAAVDLLVCKVVFNRRKDWLDIEQILFATPIDLDVARLWIERIVGPDDVRLAHYDEVVAEIIG